MGEVLRGGGEELHQPHGEVEEAAGLTAGHEAVLGLGGTAEVVPPVDLHPLAPVQLQHLLCEHPGEQTTAAQEEEEDCQLKEEEDD